MILASNSEQRKKLIKMLFLDYKNLVVETLENLDDKLTIYENLENIAFEKAEAVAKKFNIEDDYVLGVDTVVYFKNNVLLKPKDYADAYEMIKSYKNNEQKVISGIALLKIVNNKVVNKKITHVVTKVRFNNITDENIKKWLDRGLYKFCSGGFMIEKVENDFGMEYTGSYSNVIGLPLEKLKEFCDEFQISTLENDIQNSNIVKKFM